jgi:hypothetical protein
VKVIHDDPPMREEIAAGFYPGFEIDPSRLERVCSLRGPRPRRPRAQTTTKASISQRPPTIVRLDTRVPPGGDQVAVTIAKELVDLFGLESIRTGSRPRRGER